MKRIKLFEEFINQKYPSLKKIYLATKRSSGQKWLTYKDFASDKFFIQVTEDNIDKIDIDPNYPILNYHSDITQELLNRGLIRDQNIYNHPSDIKLSGSKEEFHKLVGNDKNIPKTVYTKREALDKLSLPIIAKPSHGHSGIGIKVIKSVSQLNNIDESQFDTFSEFIDKKEEMRFFSFKGNPIFWMERTALNNKAKNGDGNSNEEMQFGYSLRNPKKIPKEYTDVLKRFCNIYKKLPYICFDMMKGKDGKVYVIESNSQPGLPFDSTIKIYKNIYEDFYGQSLDSISNKKINEYSEDLIQKTLNKDKKRFSIKY